MRADIRDKWCEALESGHYQQGIGTLHHIANDTYCCLGVLSLILGSAGDWTFRDGAWRDHSNSCEVRGSLPDEVLREAGFSTSQQHTLADMNDGARCSFPEIAAYIRQHM